tara:strand:- start:34 stop:549 length:516 start_codon:yes stop_codon:yes gene_type:complete
MLYILPPIHGITPDIKQIQNEYSGIILDYENGNIYEEAQRLSQLIEGEDNILLGFSIGGLIALEIASLHTTKVKRVITVRSLTHPRHIPMRIRFYIQLLSAVPEYVFRVLYQKRHPTSNNLPSKELLTKRLGSVLRYIPESFSETYWIEPLGVPSFGMRISINDLYKNLLN